MSEGEKPVLDSMSMMRRIAELEHHNAQLNKESAKHRLKAKEYRTKAEEAAKATAAPVAELETLRKENQQLRLRGAYEREASELGVKPGKARETLLGLLGEVKEDELKARITAAKAEHDYLFNAAPAEGETPPPVATPAVKPGPGGTGRGAPADGTGTLKVRKSDFQSFDPRVNPMMDRHRAAEIEAAKKAGKLHYIDE